MNQPEQQQGFINWEALNKQRKRKIPSLLSIVTLNIARNSAIKKDTIKQLPKHVAKKIMDKRYLRTTYDSP